ncbi:hypothetical protein HHX48_10500 [Salinimonas sp. HHU 13199]|uniref:DUF5666 domain-containing protein n=1 Tax=Salinimonas profundi TaxID=2729140 RepID=A0ABR8LLH0_9ALTE|nr:hypothetical protein [Salinimonas profundi]MBD3586170.1 hypothetical protein [Salinimonas profundi]
MNANKLMLATLISTSLMAGTAIAQETQTNSVPVATSQASTTWISLTGTVTEVDSKFITMDYGEGELIVDTDTLQLDKTAFENLEDATVTVTGMLNQQLLTEGRMRASSLYLENVGTAFVAANTMAHESDMLISAAGLDLDKSEVTLIGNVTTLSDDAFQFGAGDAALTVEVDDLRDNPLDKDGYLVLKHGDRVKVTASIEDDFFEDYEIDADTIVRLQTAE